MNITIDMSFQGNYNLEVIEELGGSEHYYYPGGSTQGGKDGIMVEVVTGNRNWVGSFAFGEFNSSSVTGLFSMPDPDRFCIVSKGAAYIVSSNNPLDWQLVNVIPVKDVRPVLHQGIIIFADYTELTAYDKDGVKWRTKRLVLDGFRIKEVSEFTLLGEFWNIRNEANEIFEIDLLTGCLVNGIGPMDI